MRLVRAVALVVLALGLVGCGSDAGGASGSGGFRSLGKRGASSVETRGR